MTARACRLLLVATLVVAAVLVPALVPGGHGRPGSVAEAADLRYFDPGNIISDNLFFDGTAMSAASVQSFLDAKGSRCVAGESPCLKDYRQDTADQAKDAYCTGYAGVRQETAASIIAKVGASCGISQRVLLVLLQKEMGLVTMTRPQTWRYTKATGFSCPDTAPCNPAFQGFVSQVYFAARQFRRYGVESWVPYKAFRTHSIGYAPATSGYNNVGNQRCGTKSVYLSNYATAALYNYTPYLPNKAALDAGYGSGDSCSAYGNRNFWLYYTDWFGSTQSPGGNAIVERAQRPGASTVLGSPTGQVRCGLAGGGCLQTFQKASIYWSPPTGARIVLGSIRSRWGALGWETSRLGYPTSDEKCGLRDAGCFQTFQRGAIYWTSATGARELVGAIRAKWNAQRWETGPLGYPRTGEVCGLVGGGCLQQFEGGTIYWTRATGARTVPPGAIRSKWGAQKWETGPLGYPVRDQYCGLRDGGCIQQFQGGTVYSTSATGTNVVSGDGFTKWGTTGWENGPLGYPVADTRCDLVDGGCGTDFEHGSIYLSASTDPHVVLAGAVRDAWVAGSAESGALGYPTDDTRCQLAGGGCRSSFQGGEIAWTAATGARTVAGPARAQWAAQGREAGALGWPTGEQTCALRDGGCSQPFQGGGVYTSSAGGTRVVRADVLARWTASGAQDGQLGYPVRPMYCGLARGGCVQAFEGGLVYPTPAGGVHPVWGAIRAAYGRSGWEGGRLGYPTSDEDCGLTGGGCRQVYERGRIYYAPGRGAHLVFGAIGGAYLRSGAEAGPLGYPTRSELCGLVRGGCFQHFDRGSIYYTPATGARQVTGAIRAHWAAQRWERGSLGYPVGDAVESGGERRQAFEGGTLVEDLGTGAVTVRP